MERWIDGEMASELPAREREGRRGGDNKTRAGPILAGAGSGIAVRPVAAKESGLSGFFFPTLLPSYTQPPRNMYDNNAIVFRCSLKNNLDTTSVEQCVYRGKIERFFFFYDLRA